MQITIHEMRHFTLMTELLTFTIYFALLCKPIWRNASVSRYYRSPCPDIYWGMASPKKYLEERCSAAFRLDYTTCDGCYFQIHKLQYLCNVHVTFFFLRVSCSIPLDLLNVLFNNDIITHGYRPTALHLRLADTCLAGIR